MRGRAPAFRWAWAAVFSAAAGVEATGLIRRALGEIAHPPLWDFKVFWMVGQICTAGHNIYDVGSYAPFRAILNPTNDPEFNGIAVQIGMPYPPPAAALLCPLGHFANLQTAMAAWYAVLFVLIGVSIVLLWRQFLGAQGYTGLITVAVLVLTLPGTTLTVGFGQLNFFALLLLLVFWRERSPWRGGAWLAPLVVLRPLSLLFALYFIVRRQWSALPAFLATSALLFGLSVPIVGLSGFVSYLHQNPTQRYPEMYFKGWDSLYKILVTLDHDYDGFFSLVNHPLFMLVAAALICAAAYVCTAAGKHQRTLCLSMLLALGLLLYPNSGAHYTVLLLVPMLSLMHERQRLGLSYGALVAFLTGQYALLIFRDGALTTGLVFAMDSLVFALIALRLPRRSVDVPMKAAALLPT